MDPRPTPTEARPPRMRAARWAEPVAALACWLLLVWLSRRPQCVEPECLRSLGGGLALLTLTALAAGLAPGWMAWRLAGPRPASALSACAFACGLGLAWLTLLASAVLMSGRTLDDFVLVVSAANGVVTAAFLAWSARGRGAGGAGEMPWAGRGGRWPALLAAAALAALLAVAATAPGFTYGSDEWFYLRAVRQYLDGKGWIYDFEPWELLVAILVRLAGVPLLEGYRLLLPPLLIAAAALAFAALAEQVLGDRRAAAFAFVLQALYCLSDMHTRGTGAGMALLARVVEDKYLALLVPVPLALAAVLAALRGGPARLWAVAGVLALAGGLVHPLALVWIAVSSAGPLAARAWARRRSLRPWWVAAAAGAALAALALGAWLRSIRPASYYQLAAPESARLLATVRRQVLVLSADRGWYMADPRLLAHPLVLAALIGAGWLAVRGAGGDPARAFLVGATATPLVLAFVPPAAVWTGAWISPWLLPRLLWALPVVLTLAFVLQDRLRALEERRGGRPAPAPSTLAWTVALALVGGLLGPRMLQAVSALHQRNRVHVSPGERELMDYVARARAVEGTLLAPPGLSVRLPAWSSRVRPLPGPDALRGGLPADVAADCARLLEARAITGAHAALLDKHGIRWVAARNGSPLGRRLARLLPAFRPRFRGSVYTLYEWRPERWPQAVAARAGAGPR